VSPRVLRVLHRIAAIGMVLSCAEVALIALGYATPWLSEKLDFDTALKLMEAFVVFHSLHPRVALGLFFIFWAISMYAVSRFWAGDIRVALLYIMSLVICCDADLWPLVVIPLATLILITVLERITPKCLICGEEILEEPMFLDLDGKRIPVHERCLRKMEVSST